MKSKLPFIIATLLILVIAQAATPSTAHACSCGLAPSLKEEMDRADIVFSGTVTGFIELDEQEEVRTSCESEATVFQVTSVWKGKTQSQVVVSGSFAPVAGLRYLVFA